MFYIYLNSLGFSKFVFVLTWLTSKNRFSSDAVKCGKLQIWPLSHKVLQTPSYLSHLLRYADNTRNQGYLLDKDTCLNYWYHITSSLFFCWGGLVICLILVLTLAIMAFTSFIFSGIRTELTSFFCHLKKVCSMTEKYPSFQLIFRHKMGKM